MSGIHGDVNGLCVYFKPWAADDWFSISILNLHEELGGKTASGYMRLIVHCLTDDALEKIDKLRTGTIEIKSEVDESSILEIPIFIIELSHFNHFLDIKFICTKNENDEFITKQVSQSYDGIEDAISTFFPEYDTDIDPNTELTKLRINQINETGIEFCNKLVMGWRPWTVFGYNLEGNIIIRDISDLNNSKQDIIIGKTRFFKKFPKRTRSPLMDVDSFDPWEKESKDIEYNLTKKDFSEYTPTNISSRIYKNNYHIFSSGYAKLMEASVDNSRLYVSGFYSEGEILANTYPLYKLGDIVNISNVGPGVTKNEKDGEADPEITSSKYLIASWDLFWTCQGAEGENRDGFAFSVTSKIYGLEENE